MNSSVGVSEKSHFNTHTHTDDDGSVLTPNSFGHMLCRETMA